MDKTGKVKAVERQRRDQNHHSGSDKRPSTLLIRNREWADVSAISTGIKMNFAKLFASVENFIPTVHTSGYAIDACPKNVCAIVEQTSSLPFTFILRRFIEALAITLMLAFSVFCVANALAQAQSSPATRADNQVWSELQLAVPISDKIDLVLLGVVRFGRNVSRPVRSRTLDRRRLTAARLSPKKSRRSTSSSPRTPTAAT